MSIKIIDTTVQDKCVAAVATRDKHLWLPTQYRLTTQLAPEFGLKDHSPEPGSGRCSIPLTKDLKMSKQKRKNSTKSKNRPARDRTGTVVTHLIEFGPDTIEIVVRDGNWSVDRQRILRAIGYMPSSATQTARVSGESVYDWLQSIRPADVRPDLMWKLEHYKKGLVYAICTYLANCSTAVVGKAIPDWQFRTAISDAARHVMSQLATLVERLSDQLAETQSEINTSNRASRSVDEMIAQIKRLHRLE